eukprot:snap_masked-scaffold_17-processed-gene-5.30-mRNA-1 protein AED:1.00 eAED:1.00 QI:0/0/0/0/1/1/2/0/72
MPTEAFENSHAKRNESFIDEKSTLEKLVSNTESSSMCVTPINAKNSNFLAKSRHAKFLNRNVANRKKYDIVL